MSVALIYAINRGYQVHPDAFAFLKSLDCDVEKIIKTIVEAKNKFKMKSPILIDDIKNAISPAVNHININEPEITNTNKTIGTDDDGYKIIFDPTNMINSEEKKNFFKIFESRYKKTLKILSSRPESRQIRKIKNIKEFRKKTRFNSCRTS